MIPPAEQPAFLAVLDDLMRAVEDLASTGLTAASPATRERIEVAFREASRLKIGRLAVALRYVSEEVKRWLDQDKDFSAKRLLLFLERSWILAHALGRALRAKDEPAMRRLLGGPVPTPVAAIELVVLGVQKRVVRTNISFDFRMREVATGRPVIWSLVANAGSTEVPPEAYLHLPTAQKFTPKILLDNKVVRVEKAALAPDERGGARLLLGPPSTVVTTTPFDDWARLWTWDRAASRARVAAASPTPLDLEIELQEEIVLTDWSLGAVVDRGRAEVTTVELRAQDLLFDVSIPVGVDGKELRANLDALRKLPSRPPLFGLLHYELCRLVLTPLAVLEAQPEPAAPAKKGKKPDPTDTPTIPPAPRHLMVSTERIDTKKLLSTLKF